MDAIMIRVKGRPIRQASFCYPVLPGGGPGYIYVMGPVGAPWVKVGTTRNLRERLQGFLSESGSQQIALFFVLSHPLYEAIERCAHIGLQESRLVSERFNVTPEFAVAAISKAAGMVTHSPLLSYSRKGWNHHLSQDKGLKLS